MNPTLAALSFNPGYWILQSLAMGLTAFLIPRLRITSIFGAFFTVVSLALVNAQLWDAALFFHIPDSFSTHALLLLGANGILFWILIKILPGIEVDGFLPALVAPVVFTVCSLLISNLLADVDWLNVFDTVLTYLHSLRDYFSTTVETGANPVPGP